ncbi:hypothetical protein VIGAN_09187800 [Vigna angularis var. angularis]|uniref:Uncharacterized protein n=1 Tax=Vigna angularis var. angularis TaxID=157739 RepID=A0A0S3SZE4_PHAAN|nr:hypothetical protein VIGAN_09187800 [Vigna angularis var. angularis]
MRLKARRRDGQWRCCVSGLFPQIVLGFPEFLIYRHIPPFSISVSRNQISIVHLSRFVILQYQIFHFNHSSNYNGHN